MGKASGERFGPSQAVEDREGNAAQTWDLRCLITAERTTRCVICKVLHIVCNNQEEDVSTGCVTINASSDNEGYFWVNPSCEKILCVKCYQDLQNFRVMCIQFDGSTSIFLSFCTPFQKNTPLATLLFRRVLLPGIMLRRASTPAAAYTTIIQRSVVPPRLKGRMQNEQHRSHYSYPDGPGHFHSPHSHSPHSHEHDHDDSHSPEYPYPIRTIDRNLNRRAFTVGIGGPVGSGKTATVLELCRTLPSLWRGPGTLQLGVVTNDIFTQEDAEFLQRQQALPAERILAVETGGCPHAAIREDISANLSALERLTQRIRAAAETQKDDPILLLCESGGDNLAANFSRELADLTLYVIDVAGGDKVPRKGGPGITQSDLLIINKIDLAVAVGCDLRVMQQDADRMRALRLPPPSTTTPALFVPPVQSAPTFLCAVKHTIGVAEIGNFILAHLVAATRTVQKDAAQ